MALSSSHPAAAAVATVLAQHGVKHAVVSPGSRNAPIVLALHRHPDIEVRVSIDERAAAHHALGMALATWTPVPVICTSGTAAINHGPALAEAFHARIPLLSITADRPASVVGKGHGQTIHQAHVHSAHTLAQDLLDESTMGLEELKARMSKAIQTALHGGPGNAAGPVHLNVPFDEPLYDLAPLPEALTLHSEQTSTPSPEPAKLTPSASLMEALRRGRVLVIAGPRPTAAALPQREPKEVNMPCMAERGSHVVGPCITFGAERMLINGSLPTELTPDAILTVGLPPMSKALRKALSGVPHWHIGEDLTGEGMGWDVWDALQGSAPESVLTSAAEDAFFKAWTDAKRDVEALSTHFKAEWSDLNAWHTLTQCFSSWPEKRRPKALHVANSASARYAQWVDLHRALHPKATIHANRGVAGIDGCTSTALGWHAIARHMDATHQTWLITGDIAFHYDSNAFLTDPLPTGLRIVVMNNGGGGIFRWLPGTQHADMFQRHFETPPTRHVRDMAQAMNATYLRAENKAELERAIQAAEQTEGNAVVEVVTSSEESASEQDRYLNLFRESKSKKNIGEQP
jgi:2-succinyl-5-enolpyruvyl-6-hydroxy-3-cyclohexene-1-carboxylate synthase